MAYLSRNMQQFSFFFKESEVRIPDKMLVITTGIDIDYVKHEVLKYTKIV